MDIILVHGYNVTSTNTYGVLPQRLADLGHTVRNVYLSKYITLDNDITLPDLIKAFDFALRDVLGANFGSHKFACLTHSTGGLVARGWVSSYFEDRMSACPISHLIMLAPPHHGSRLTTLGKSRVNRLRSIWGVEPGLQILNALELGSVTQWDLNTRWMDKGTHQSPGFFPVIITGQWIDKEIWDVIIPATYERGSDGVVRVCSANLNMKKIIVGTDAAATTAEISGIPFLITPKTAHSDEKYGIMQSIPASGDHPALNAIVQALSVADSVTYQNLQAIFSSQTNALQKTEPYYDGTLLDRYAQLVVRVKDNRGEPLKDYALEFIDSERRGDRFPKGFLVHTSQNCANPEQYVFYLDYDQLLKVAGGQVGLKVQSVPHSPLIMYDELFFIGPETQVDKIFQPNQTTYLEVTLRRRLNKNLFQLTSDLTYQKIEGQPGPDWIE